MGTWCVLVCVSVGVLVEEGGLVIEYLGKARQVHGAAVDVPELPVRVASPHAESALRHVSGYGRGGRVCI